MPLDKACLRVDPNLAPELEQAVPPARYAWKFRYPGSPEEPTAEEAREALAVARELVAMLLPRLPEEVRP